MIKTKRVYEKAAISDGVRFLVERLWPRGVKKETLKMKAWLKEAAPSPELRKWFAHDPQKWDEFQKRYRAELKSNPEAWHPILDAAGKEALPWQYPDDDAGNGDRRALSGADVVADR